VEKATNAIAKTRTSRSIYQPRIFTILRDLRGNALNCLDAVVSIALYRTLPNAKNEIAPVDRERKEA
jgi:hypothetical protein